jgi:predicted esterase
LPVERFRVLEREAAHATLSAMTTAALHRGQRVLQAGLPLGQGRAVMIMLHGRGASPEDIIGLKDVLDRPTFTYLAPAAANNTWYPYSFLSDIPSNEPWLSSALEVLADLVKDTAAQGIPRERIVLFGFSQGACLSGELAVRNAERYGGVVMLSGGLIGPPGTQWDFPGDFSGTPAFLGCSDIDPHIPKARVEESAAVLERMGATVTSRLYPGMGHLVNEDEIAAARAIMDQLLARHGV